MEVFSNASATRTGPLHPLTEWFTRFRTRAILKEQRALGWQTMQVTGPKT